MLPGDFGFAHSGTRFSWWVNVFQTIIGDKSQYTHVFVVYDSETALECHRKGGVIKRPITDYKNVVYASYPLTEHQRQLILQEAERLLGAPYNWLSYIVIFLMHFRKCPRWLVRKIINGQGFVCSQFVYYLYEFAGVQLLGPKKTWINVTPGRLSYLLEQ
jgi:hypothetical protein